MRLFVSSAQEDRELRDFLQQQHTIETNIRKSDAFLFVVNRDSLRSEQCRRDLDKAIEKNKPIVPVIVEDGLILPDALAAYPSVNLAGALSFHSLEEELRYIEAGLALERSKVIPKARPRIAFVAASLLVTLFSAMFVLVGRAPEPALSARDYALEADGLYRSGDYARALDYYNQAIALGYESVWVYNSRGLAYLRIENYPMAIADFSKVIELNPNSSSAHHNRALANHVLGNYDLALAGYNRGLSLNPLNPANYFNSRGFLYYDIGAYEQALSDFGYSIQLASLEASPYDGRGFVYYELGEYDRAMAYFNRAIDLDPRFADPYRGLANIYYDQGRRDEARENYRRYLDLVDSDPRIYLDKEEDMQIVRARLGELQHRCNRH